MSIFKSFASDNNAGIHPEVLDAIARANTGHAVGYGDDPFTAAAIANFKRHLGESAEVFFVFNGTAGNVLALEALARPYEAVICAQTAHINVDECGAPERYTGCKLIAIPTADGKLTPGLIEPHLHGIGDQHHVQAGVISITQSTELGTRYSPAEVCAIADFAHQRGLRLHMDGARVCNAAAGLDLPLRAVSGDCGVDVLTFGGTKNGLMGGEAVVFLKPDYARNFKFMRKQGMQLASKMRFVAAQFDALLSDDLWLRNARHANSMAQVLADRVQRIPGVTLTRPPQANAVFAVLPQAAVDKLLRRFFFYVWSEDTGIPGAVEVRWMTSFDTAEQDIEQFAGAVRECVAG